VCVCVRVCVRVSLVVYKVGGAQFAKTSCVCISAVFDGYNKSAVFDGYNKMVVCLSHPGVQKYVFSH